MPIHDHCIAILHFDLQFGFSFLPPLHPCALPFTRRMLTSGDECRESLSSTNDSLYSTRAAMSGLTSRCDLHHSIRSKGGYRHRA